MKPIYEYFAVDLGFCTEEMYKYEIVKDTGSGNFSVARFMRNKETKELATWKYIDRRHKIGL